MVFVEAAPRLLHVELERRGLLPWHVGEPLEIRARYVVLGGLGLHRGEASDLLAGDLLDFVGQPGGAEALAELFDLVFLAALAELLFDGAHLLAEDLLALRLAFVGDHRRHLALHAEELELAVDDGEDGAAAGLRLECLEDLLLVRDAGLLDGEVRRDEVGQGAALADVVEDARSLPREVREEREDVAGAFAEARAEGVELGVALRGPRRRAGRARACTARGPRGERCGSARARGGRPSSCLARGGGL